MWQQLCSGTNKNIYDLEERKKIILNFACCTNAILIASSFLDLCCFDLMLGSRKVENKGEFEKEINFLYGFFVFVWIFRKIEIFGWDQNWYYGFLFRESENFYCFSFLQWMRLCVYAQFENWYNISFFVLWAV